MLEITAHAWPRIRLRCPIPSRLTNEDELHELNDGHLGVVALTGHGPENSAVAAFPIRISLRSILEECMHELLVVHESQGLESEQG